jgi:1-acyl-sn-glycerol-3-phosphate acyltransferase
LLNQSTKSEIRMKSLLNVFQILLIWIWTAFICLVGLVLVIGFSQQFTIYWTSQFWSGFIFGISGVKLKVVGVENIPLNESVIYVSNHSSSFDIPALFWGIPVPLFYLAKMELKNIPFFGWFIQAVGMVFVDRANHVNAMSSLMKAGNEIKKGKNIITFPEGGRTRDGEIKQFRRGSFILALENNIDIIPIAISGARAVNPPGYRITPGTITITIGKRFNTREYDSKEPDFYAKEVENWVRNTVAKI